MIRLFEDTNIRQQHMSTRKRLEDVGQSTVTTGGRISCIAPFIYAFDFALE